MVTARLHDGSSIDLVIEGDGPASLLLPVNPWPVEGQRADVLRQYGVEPDLGRALIDGLKSIARVIAFDYEGHVQATPKPETLTPTNITVDLLAVADAAGADRVAYYGYSWLAMVGLQLALGSDRVSGLAMGGYPPIDGPYADMLRVTAAGHAMAGGEGAAVEDEWSAAGLSKAQTRQFVVLYEALQAFDDRAALPRLTCPRLCFVGSADEIQYGPAWGDVFVSLARPVVGNRSELEELGWEVHVLDGLDHTTAMQSVQVLPLLQPWLARVATAAR